MSRNYDNWERLVAAVLKKEQLWQLFHAQSRSPSVSSESSGFSFSFGLASSIEDASISSPKWSASNQEDRVENIDDGTSSFLVKDQRQSSVVNPLPDKNVASKPFWKRALKIDVPKLRVQHRGGISSAKDNSRSSPQMGSSTSSSKDHSPPVMPPAGGKHHLESSNWPDYAKQESYPLPLPPGTSTRLSPVSSQNSAETSPSVPRSPGRAENPRSNQTHWKRGKLLGKGAFGDIYLGFDSEAGAMCAIKEVNLSLEMSKKSAKALEKEIELLSSFSHPNIVQYYGSETVGDRLYLYFEYASGGSIHKLLKQYGKFGEPVIRCYTQQILAGLAYLHSKNMTHGDIKGASVLVDPNGIVKLINLSIENCIMKQLGSSLLTTSPYWMAPEAIMNSDMCNQQMDIWSLGCTVIEMATTKPPMSQFNGITAMFKVANKKELPTIPDHLSEEGKNFLRHCLQLNPVHRATAPMLLEHPFVKSWLPLVKPTLVVSPPRNFMIADSVKPEGPHARTVHQPTDPGRHKIHSSRASKSQHHYMPNFSSNADIYTPRNISAPVSPLGSPLPHPSSPQHPLNTDIYTRRYISAPVSPLGSPLPHPSSPQHPLNGRMSPPPAPHTPSPSSTPRTADPYSHLNQSMSPWGFSRNFLDLSPSPSYWDPNILHGLHSGTHASREPTDEAALVKQFGSAANECSAMDAQGLVRFLRPPVKFNPYLI